MIPNLAVDHVSPIALARSGDVYAAIVDAPFRYEMAARELGLSPKEYADFRAALISGDAQYVVLPRHIDAMTGRKRSGRVYVLRNVTVPSGTMGWEVRLADRATVYIPQACGNLSLSRFAVGPVPKHHAPTPHNVSYRGYFPPTVVSFAAPPSYAPAGSSSVKSSEAPVLNAPPVASGKTGFPFGFLAPLVPIVAGFIGGGSSHSSPPIALCSAGSNAMGVCRP